MKKHLLIYVVVGVAIFIAGIVCAPLIHEKGYQIKEWTLLREITSLPRKERLSPPQSQPKRQS